MRKNQIKLSLFILVFGIFLIGNVHGYNNCEPRPECDDPFYEGESIDFGVGGTNNVNDDLSLNCLALNGTIVEENGVCKSCIIDGEANDCKDIISNNDVLSVCPQSSQYMENGIIQCCQGTLVPDQNDPTQKACIVNNEGSAGITMDADCLTNGQCKYNIYETLGIRKSDQNPSVTTFVQDIVLAATTFIGTVVTIILVISGVLYIIAGIKGDTSMAEKAKKGLFNAMIGMLFVVTSYAIVRLIQFLATGGGG